MCWSGFTIYLLFSSLHSSCIFLCTWESRPLVFHTDSFQNQLELVAVLSLFAWGINWAFVSWHYLWMCIQHTSDFFFLKRLLGNWNAESSRWQIITQNCLQVQVKVRFFEKIKCNLIPCKYWPRRWIFLFSF